MFSWIIKYKFICSGFDLKKFVCWLRKCGYIQALLKTLSAIIQKDMSHVNDRSADGVDFVRGYPFSLRECIPTACLMACGLTFQVTILQLSLSSLAKKRWVV
ncbi:hypothetical protein L6452_05371 [Arctium lappa]|uniref:Uncharacterized protein n=1 Tax=Arctium lappa TaxID=4217 RepID=A0ACB9EGY0_ARCLA|nr:hypothetical protein L6452_05371 [Arctium lappa]